MAELGRLILGRYALLRVLARGGMGSIYLARTEGAAGFRRPVVVKLIHPHLMDDPEAVRSFVREAKLAARLVHPNIVQVIDFGEHEGQYLAVLDHVHGRDLDVLARYLAGTGRPMSVPHSAYVVHQVLRGLEFAHGLADDEGRPLGLVHRDISPHNVLVSAEGLVKLTDFGVARVSTEKTRSGPGDLKGKLAYMAPEQVTGGAVDHRTDLFAVGIVLFEVLTGARLFASEHEAQTIMRVSRAEVPDPRELRAEVPDEAVLVLRRALARKPADRYQDAGTFAADLRRLLPGASPEDVEPSFRAMVAETLAEPGLTALAGPLPDLAAAIQGEPLAFSPSRATTWPRPRPRRRRVRWPTLLAIGAGVALLTGGISAALLLGFDPRERDLAGRSVAMIIDRSREDAGAASAHAARDARPADAGEAETAGSHEDAGPAPVTRPVPLTGRTVTRHLMRRRAAFGACFREHGGPASGRAVVARLEIEGSGAVRSATIEPEDLDGSPLGRCLAGVARGASFPPHPEAVVAFRVPMRLEED